MATREKIVKALSKRINSLRQARGMSYQGMASACDIDKAQAYNICTSGVDLRTSSLMKIAKGFDISLSELMDF